MPKTFPPGTFIPTSQRLMAIGQLCLAFSLLIWYMAQPFMGEYFALRSRMLLYEYAMGTSDILKARPGQEAKLERQAQNFKQLPVGEKQLLEEDYQNLQNYAKRPPLKKIEEGFRLFVRDIPPFEQAWIFFSIVIAILILLKKEGAKQAAWILPLIVMAYAVDNQLTGIPQSASPDYHLFPKEELIVQNYLTEPLSPILLEQKEQLEKGWNRYLIDNWSSNQTQNENDQPETAEFNFTVARLNLLHSQPRSEWLHVFHEKLGLFPLFLYLLWNGLFAWVCGARPIFVSIHNLGKTTE